MSDFINVCGLYRREGKSGRVVHFGTWAGTRVYLVENERGDEPAYWLAVRYEDYAAANGAHPKITRVEEPV